MPTSDHEYNLQRATHQAAERDAHAITLNMITGDVQASLDLVLPMTTDEHIAVIASLASQLATALGRVHGTQTDAATVIRRHMIALAADH